MDIVSMKAGLQPKVLGPIGGWCWGMQHELSIKGNILRYEALSESGGNKP